MDAIDRKNIYQLDKERLLNEPASKIALLLSQHIAEAFKAHLKLDRNPTLGDVLAHILPVDIEIYDFKTAAKIADNMEALQMMAIKKQQAALIPYNQLSNFHTINGFFNHVMNNNVTPPRHQLTHAKCAII